MGFSDLLCEVLLTGEPQLDVAPAILVTVLIGAAIGVFNGILVTVFNLGSFIATLGTTPLLVGAAALFGDGEYLGPFADSFRAITRADLLGVPVLTVYLVLIASVAWYFLEHTPGTSDIRHRSQTQLKPGRFNIWGTVLAIYLLGTGVQGLRLAGADLWVTDVFNGLALLAAVAITVDMQKRRGRREVKAKVAEAEAVTVAD